MNINQLRRIATLILRKQTWQPTQLIQETKLIYQIRQLSLTVRRLGDEESGQVSKKKKRMVVSVQESIEYMNSEEFKKSYKNGLIWTHYRRNYKGPVPQPTRESCVRGAFTSTGSPCPICRDEYLVVDYQNIKLIEQFTDPVTGELYETTRTGVCQKQQRKLELEKFKAMEYGLIEGNVAFRKFNYKHLDDQFGILDEKIKQAKITNFNKWRAKRAHAKLKTESEKPVEA